MNDATLEATMNPTLTSHDPAATTRRAPRAAYLIALGLAVALSGCVDDESTSKRSSKSTCATKDDCGGGEYCQQYCGNGWCAGICLAEVAPACGADADCGAGEHCEQYCGNGWCAGTCVADQEPDPGCTTDAECGEGQSCQQYCGNGWCQGVCLD